MDKLILDGIRCFRTKQEVPIKPLTLLVGENSTGKSTFLAVLRIAYDTIHADVEPNFNEEPFNLGAYGDIANYTAGRGGRAKCFVLGFETGLNEEGPSRNLPDGRIRFTATFCQEASHPRIDEVRIESGPYSLLGRYDAERKGVQYAVSVGSRKIRLKTDKKWEVPPHFDLQLVRFLIRRHWASKKESANSLDPADVHVFEAIVGHLLWGIGPRPYAMAPVRTKPERTYDPKTDTPQPEGRHVPMVLARMSSGEREKWPALRKALSEFGEASGLFDSVRVRRPLGKKESDPFQIQVKISGPPFNLVDVGYGVSQVLPIIVDAFIGQEWQTFLMQQPEVHLHPRAQAQLGSFLAQLVKHDHKRFVIETHSDYLIDRVRIDIRDGVGLRPEDVVILYFQRKGSGVRIHPVSIDDRGNIVGAPKGYRQFFLDEQKQFLGM